MRYMALVFLGGFLLFLSRGGFECDGRFWGKENFVMLGRRERQEIKSLLALTLGMESPHKYGASDSIILGVAFA